MPPETLQLLPPELSQRLRAMDRKLRVLAVLRGVALLFSLVVLGTGFALLMDLFVVLSVSVRLTLLAGVFALGVGVFVWKIVRPAVRPAHPDTLAALIESAHPELHERLTSTIELLRPDIPEAHKGSPYMRELLARQTVETLDRTEITDAADERPARRAGWWALGAAVLLLTPFLIAREGYSLLLTRFAVPWQNLERASNLHFIVTDGDRTVARGSDVVIHAEPHWRSGEEEDQPLPEEVLLIWSTATQAESNVTPSEQRRMAWNADANAFVATLPQVLQPFSFEVASGTARTRQFRVNVVESPVIDSLILDIQPPAYTGLPPQHIDGAIGETRVFESSRVEFTLRFNKPIQQAELEWTALPNSPPLQLGIADQGLSASADLVALPLTSGPFRIRIFDEHGLSNLPDDNSSGDEPYRSMQILPDRAPVIAFADQVVQPQARPDDVLNVPITTSDDIAIDQLDLHFHVQPSGRSGVLTARRDLLGTRTVDYNFRLDLKTATDALGTPLSLKEGESISLRARAADARPEPAPNESWTDERIILLNDAANPYSYEALAQIRQQWRDLIASIRKELEKNRDATREMQQQATTNFNRRGSFPHDAHMPQLSGQQKEQAARLEQLATLFEQHPLFESLAGPARNIAREELVRASTSVDQVPKSELDKKYDLLQSAHTDVQQAITKLKVLEKSFESLAALERDLSQVQRLADRAKRLSDDSQSLDRQRRLKPPEETPEQKTARDAILEAQRQSLQQEHRELTADLDSLVDGRPEILDAARERQFDRLREIANEALAIARPQSELAADLSQQHQQDPRGNDAKVFTEEELAAAAERAEAVMALQQQIARAAAEMAFDTAAETGPQSPQTQQAIRFAEQATHAAEQMLTGRFPNAATLAKDAAQAGEQTARQLTQPGQAAPEQELGRKVQTLAEQQQQLLERLNELSTDDAARTAVQSRGQEQMARQTESLADRLKSAAEQLATNPLDRPEQGRHATDARQAAVKGAKSIDASIEELAKRQTERAAEGANAAAEELERVAEQARTAAGDPPSKNSPVPGEVGQQITDAMRQLQQAGRRLEQMLTDDPTGKSSGDSNNEGREGADGKPSDEGTPMSQDGKASENGQSSPSGEGEPSDEGGQSDSDASASDSLQKVADSLNQAAEQLGLMPGSQQSSANPQNDGNQSPGNPSADGAAANSGANQLPRLTELDQQIRGLSSRNWGQLQERLQSNVLEAGQSRSGGDYAPVIQRYFDEVSRTRRATSP